MSEWQPIETAPRDGTVILLAWSRRNERFNTAVRPGFWDKDRKNFPWVAVIEGCSYAAFDAWREDGPTHWHPLPDPPGDSHD